MRKNKGYFKGVLIVLIILFSCFFLEQQKTLLVACIFINTLIILKVRKVIYLLLFFLFLLLYTLAFYPYYFSNTDISPWPDFNERIYYNKVLVIHFVFLAASFLYVFFFKLNKELIIPSNPNKIGFYSFIILLFLLTLLGQSGENIFDSGGYANGDSSKSTLYEYYVMFFLVCYYFSNKSKFEIALLILSSLLYTFKSMIYGGRIEVLQVFLLMLYIGVYDFRFKINFKRIIISFLILYYINSVFGSIRSNPLPLLEGHFTNYLIPFFNDEIQDRGYISSNEGDVIQSSVRLIGLIENGYLDAITRIRSLFGFVLSIFVPSSLLGEEASLITYMKDIFNSGGGGLASVYFYTYMWWIGPVIISLYPLLIMNFVNNNKYLQFYGIMIFCTFPRWLVYNPIILFKLCLWVIPVVFLSIVFFNYLRALLKQK